MDFDKYGLFIAAIYQIVELAKLLYDREKHKFNPDLGVALVLGLLVSFGVPLDAFAAVGVKFLGIVWIGKLLTGLLLGGFGAGILHSLAKFYEKKITS